MALGGRSGVDHGAGHLRVTRLARAPNEVNRRGLSRSFQITNIFPSLTVFDNGRGIPVDTHPKYPGKSALEVIMTTLHSGGKFEGKAYSTSGGLHGVGVSVVNALSTETTVEVAREKTLYRQSFSKGVATSPLETVGAAPNLSIARTDEAAPVEPRTHLDLYTDQPAVEIARLRDLGADLVDWPHYPEAPDFTVLADPDGNRFCVIDKSGGNR